MLRLRDNFTLRFNLPKLVSLHVSSRYACKYKQEKKLAGKLVSDVRDIDTFTVSPTHTLAK